VFRQIDKVAEKRSTYYKDIINRLSYVINREAIAISATIVKGDFKTLFLVNINIEHRKERLTVLVLLDTEYQLSIVVDY
jgi:hypothetical protein